MSTQSDPSTGRSAGSILARGRYSDAKTAGSAAVELRLDHRGLLIDRIPGLGETLVWPYGALKTDTPISRKADEAIVTYSHMPGATVYVDDATFVTALTRAAPHLTTASHRWQWFKPLLAASAVISMIGAGMWFAGLKPARTLARLMPESARSAFGKKVVRYVSANRARCVAPDGEAALQKMLARLMPDLGLRSKFNVVTVDWALVNAFAAPGGQIVLTRGLVQAAQSPEEVAGVLGHEIGHGLELHPESGLIRAVGLSAMMDIMLGGSSGTLGSLSGVMIQSSYAREDEHAADVQALRLMREGAISQSGLVDFFKRIASGKITGARDDGGPSAFDLIRTHPRPGERAKYVAATPRYPSRPILRDAEWRALKNICNQTRRAPR